MTVTTVVLGPTEGPSGTLADALDATVGEFDSDLPAEVGSAVIVVGTELGQGQPPALVDVSAEDWQRTVGDVMWRTLVALQRVRAAMQEAGGRIVVVLPTIGMAGAAHLVAYTTALEGIRSMVKSAARQWASDGIAINTIAAPLQLFAPRLGPSAGHLTAAANRDDDSLIDSVVETTKFLLRRDVAHLVGETVIVDGGAVMLP